MTIPLTQLLLQLLVVIVAAFIGMLSYLFGLRWSGGKIWVAIYAMLFLFGAVLLLVKVT